MYAQLNMYDIKGWFYFFKKIKKLKTMFLIKGFIYTFYNWYLFDTIVHKNRNVRPLWRIFRLIYINFVKKNIKVSTGDSKSGVTAYTSFNIFFKQIRRLIARQYKRNIILFFKLVVKKQKRAFCNFYIKYISWQYFYLFKAIRKGLKRKYSIYFKLHSNWYNKNKKIFRCIKKRIKKRLYLINIKN